MEALESLIQSIQTTSYQDGSRIQQHSNGTTIYRDMYVIRFETQSAEFQAGFPFITSYMAVKFSYKVNLSYVFNNITLQYTTGSNTFTRKPEF